MIELSRVLPGYTGCMKTAISVPDATFEEATKRARELGISRSEFFSTAARRYLDDLARESLTRQIDQALDLPGYDEDASSAAVSAGHQQLSADDW
jgi:antitoxin MazE6